MSKNKVGRILLGSAVVIAGLSLYVYFDDNARSKVEGVINREKAKAFIRQNLSGSASLVDAIDNLSDNEVNTVMKLISETDKVASKAGETMGQFVEKAKDLGTDVVNRVSDFIG